MSWKLVYNSYKAKSLIEKEINPNEILEIILEEEFLKSYKQLYLNCK